MIGKKILHYHITEKLGQGGMGVVYKAEDTKLDRLVALKFLPSQLAADETDQARFLQEAKAASAINHPNVCVIHDIQECDGELFIVMEYVEGKTLREIVGANDRSPLQISVIIDYAIQIAEGLAAAHSKGVIHRDVKSENIMVTPTGQIKVMDFGLAKLKGSLKLTKTASTLGTVAYMSPEQVLGREVDARSDIFSFGVVLHEMVTGQLPFRGEYEQAVMYLIVNQEPEPIQKYRPDISSELLHLLNRTLEKQPNDRYQSMNDTIIDLKRVKRESEKGLPKSAGVVPAHREAGKKPKRRLRSFVLPVVILSILLLIVTAYLMFFGRAQAPLERITLAVADFDNKTNEKELDGLSDLLITALDQSRRLNVITRDRMFDIVKQMNKQDVSHFDNTIAKEICLHADVKVLVTASIRKLGKLYTIDLKVNDVAKNEYLYTDRAQGEGQESVLSLIDQLSDRMRKNLKEKDHEIKTRSDRVAEIATSNLEAHKHYFAAIELHNKREYWQALDELDKAISLDSTYALAYFRKILFADRLGWSDEIRKRILNQALTLIDRLPERERLFLQAISEKETKGWEAGVALLKEMERIYPDDKEMLFKIGEWYFYQGNFNIAEEYCKRVLKIDPAHTRALQQLTWTYEERGLYEQEFEAAKRFVAVSGTMEGPYYEVAKASALTGKFYQGIEILQRARNLFPALYQLNHYMAAIYAHKGDYDKAEEELKLLTKKDKSFEVRKYGYDYLIGLYPYQGKYRDVLRAYDEYLKEFGWQANDTLTVGWCYQSKAAMMIWGWNDISNSKKTAEQSLPYLRKYTGINSWYGLLLAYFGTYSTADSIAKLSADYWEICIHSLIQMRQDCAIVSSYPDNYYLKPQWNHFQIFLNYHIAECQIEIGQLDEALKSINRLQNKFEIWWARAVFYPKSFYLLGNLYEKKGDKAQAIRSYEKLIDLWKNGDQDLPELIDAKARLAKLKEKD